jgi:hypothetical protein
VIGSVPCGSYEATLFLLFLLFLLNGHCPCFALESYNIKTLSGATLVESLGNGKIKHKSFELLNEEGLVQIFLQDGHSRLCTMKETILHRDKTRISTK